LGFLHISRFDDGWLLAKLLLWLGSGYLDYLTFPYEFGPKLMSFWDWLEF
jgi:hypothetical protein